MKLKLNDLFKKKPVEEKKYGSFKGLVNDGKPVKE
jgi:hypothetical protein